MDTRAVPRLQGAPLPHHLTSKPDRRIVLSVFGAVNTTDKIIAAAKAAGVEVTLTQRPKGEGEIVLLPGLREAKQT